MFCFIVFELGTLKKRNSQFNQVGWVELYQSMEKQGNSRSSFYVPELVKRNRKEKLISILQSNYDEAAPIEVNNKHWTLADLFVRQWLNNGEDGFGMINVEQMYILLCNNKQLIIDHNLISKSATNNFGYALWNDYNFDVY